MRGSSPKGAHTPSIEEIALADDPRHWEALGFAVADATVQLGDVRIALAGREAGKGILGWSLRGVTSVELDGLPTACPQPPAADSQPQVTSPQMPATPPPADPHREPTEHPHRMTAAERPDRATAAEHPNGVDAIDHVVAMSPALDRSVRMLRDAGLQLRRIREQPTPAGAPRQAFFRLGAVILEVVQVPAEMVERSGGPDGPARFWGLALLCEDLDRTVARLGAHASDIRPAVQPGRRIATLRRSAGLSVPVALMSRADA